MKRRHLLARAQAGAIVCLAGCVGSLGTDDGPATEPGSPDESPSPPHESTPGTRSTRPGPGTEHDPPCPPVETGRDSAVCSHTVDPETAPIHLDVTPERSPVEDGTPSETVTLTLYNHSASELRFNPSSWRIWRETDSGWEELPQELSGDGHVTVQSDGTHSWTFTDAVESIRSEPSLEPGLYAAAIGVPDPEQSDAWVACIALVDLEPAE